MNTQWARAQINNVGAFTDVKFDLLAQWRVANGITLNLPDIKIWRVILKISIHYTLSPAVVTASNGVFYALFVDSVTSGAPVLASSAPYDESYMWWDVLYQSDTLANGANPQDENITLYKSLDIRSHRKLPNQNDTLLLELAPRGNVSFGAADTVDITSNVLLKLPGRG